MTVGCRIPAIGVRIRGLREIIPGMGVRIRGMVHRIQGIGTQDTCLGSQNTADGCRIRPMDVEYRVQTQNKRYNTRIVPQNTGYRLRILGQYLRIRAMEIE